MKKLITLLCISLGSIGLWHCKKNTTAPPTSPELIISISPSSTNVAPSAMITLTATVSNTGARSSDASTLRWYRSTDSTIDTDDTEVGTSTLSSLMSGDGRTEMISITVTNIPGTYYYGVCVDSVRGESDPNDNCSSAVRVVVTSPELIISISPSSTNVTPSAMITLTATVSNTGARSSDGSTLRWYRSTDSTIDTDDTEVGTSTLSSLMSGDGRTEMISITVTNIPGTYYYGVCVDSVRGESDPNDNCSSAVRVVVTSPELIISISPSSTNVTPSAMITLTATVSNTGARSSDGSTLRWYRSTDSTIDTDDTEVGTSTLSSLMSGDGRTEMISITVTNIPGTYYYGVCVDSVRGESDPNDNCSSAVRSLLLLIVVTSPELIISISPSSTNVAPSAMITLTATVSNTGARSSDASTLRWYRSTDSTIDTSDTEVGMNTLSSLMVDEGRTEMISITVTNAPGTYYYGACVDSVTGEYDPNDNCSSAVRVVVTAPDLVVTNMMASSTNVLPFEMITLTATVSNTGARSSDASTLRWYLSTDSTIDTNTDTEIETDAVNILAAGGRSTETISITVTNAPGTYYYGACIDSVRGESDPNDNCSSAVRVVITAPELIVTNMMVSRTNVAPSAMITLTATVSNTGARSSDASTLRWYRSTDSTIDTNDTEVGMNTLSSLMSGDGRTEMISITVTNAPGTYYYGACVDSVTGEYDTNDNCSSAVRVVITAPELIVTNMMVSSANVLPFEMITLTATVSNTGARFSDASTLRWYRSTDSTIDTNDTEVGMNTLSSLMSGDGRTEMISITVTNAPGTYYYGACVE